LLAHHCSTPISRQNVTSSACFAVAKASKNTPSAITRFAQELDVAFGVAAARRERDDVIKLETLIRAALHTVALVVLPSEESN
jgi:hypothetical protein